MGTHNTKMKTNMERMLDSIVTSARMVGANLRKSPQQSRNEDAARVNWRINYKSPQPPVKSFDTRRFQPGAGMEQFVETHTRKMTGVPLSKWSPAEKETIRRFLESLDDIGTRAW